MHDTGSQLRFNVVAYDRNTGITEPLGPSGIGRNKHGDRIDKGNACLKAGYGVVLLRLIRSSGNVRHQDVCFGGAKLGCNIDCLYERLLNRVAIIVTEAIECWPASNNDA